MVVLIIWLFIAICVRRYHDIERENGYYGKLIVFYLAFAKGKKGENEYGMDPRDCIVLRTP